MNTKSIRNRVIKNLFHFFSAATVLRSSGDGFNFSEPEVLCTAFGYVYDKYDRPVRTIKIPGRIGEVKTKRIALFPDGCVRCIDNNTCTQSELPEILENDIIKIKDISYRVSAILENLEVYNTYVVEKL